MGFEGNLLIKGYVSLARKLICLAFVICFAVCLKLAAIKQKDFTFLVLFPIHHDGAKTITCKHKIINS